MNSYYENRPRRKSAYDDFDAYGNPLTGNTNSLSHYTPQSKYGSFGQYNYGEGHERRQDDDRITNASRAHGSLSGGTRYGEGGNRQGNVSSYGHSSYGPSGNMGSGMRPYATHRPESRRYSEPNNYDHFINRNYGPGFGRTSDGGYVNENYNRPGRQEGRPFENNAGQVSFGNRDRRDIGYNRGFVDYEDTGYGSTGFNNRDQDRMRSAYSSNRQFENRPQRNNWDDDRIERERGYRD